MFVLSMSMGSWVTVPFTKRVSVVMSRLGAVVVAALVSEVVFELGTVSVI